MWRLAGSPGRMTGCAGNGRLENDRALRRLQRSGCRTQAQLHGDVCCCRLATPDAETRLLSPAKNLSGTNSTSQSQCMWRLAGSPGRMTGCAGNGRLENDRALRRLQRSGCRTQAQLHGDVCCCRLATPDAETRLLSPAKNLSGTNSISHSQCMWRLAGSPGRMTGCAGNGRLENDSSSSCISSPTLAEIRLSDTGPAARRRLLLSASHSGRRNTVAVASEKSVRY